MVGEVGIDQAQQRADRVASARAAASGGIGIPTIVARHHRLIQVRSRRRWQQPHAHLDARDRGDTLRSLSRASAAI